MPLTEEKKDREQEAERRQHPTSVFEWMERVKMPALWICVIIMGGFGVIGLISELFGRGGMPAEEEIGSYEIPGGGKVVQTNVTWAQEAQSAIPQLHFLFGGRGGGNDDVQIGQNALRVQIRDNEELAWAWMMLRDAARASGILVTDEVAFAAQKKFGRLPEDMTFLQYQTRVSDDRRAFWRDLISIMRFRGSIDSALPEATYEMLYERFKTTYEDLRASFVLFDDQKAEIAMDPKNNPEDRKKLETWLSENPGIRSQKRMPEEIDASVLYVRFKDETTANLKKQYDERWAPLAAELKIEVTDEKLRQRHEMFKGAWDVPTKLALEEYEKSLASRPDSQSTAPKDRPTEFELIRDRLRIEWIATRLIEKAFEEVSRAENPMKLEDAMARYGLKLTDVSHLDSLHIQQHPDFASPRAAMSMMTSLREKTMKPGDFYNYRGDPSVSQGAVEEPGSSVAIWKITGYRPEREATLDESTDFFVDEYKKKKRQDLAKEEAEGFRKAVEERVNAAVAPKLAELETAMNAEVDKQLKEAGLDRANAEHKPRILEIENAERQKKDAKADSDRAQVEPNMFMAVAAERFLPVHDTGWIPKTTNRNATFAASDKLTTAEKVEQFFRKSARRLALAGLKPGRMGQVETEPGWSTAAVPLLLEKREPKPEDLYKLSKSQLDTLKRQVVPNVQSTTFWNYDNFKRPEWFNLNVPSIEKGLVVKREQDQKKAEQQRLRDEAKRKQARARAEKIAQDAMQSRPLFSGEDW